MRQIKFRFWNGHAMLCDHDGWIEDIGINEAIRCSKEYGYEIMQFTGFKDNTGFDIYEGDILDAKFKVTVKWFDGRFEVVNDDTIACTYSLREWLAMRIRAKCPSVVLGNIHANYELLNVQKWTQEEIDEINKEADELHKSLPLPDVHPESEDQNG